MRILIIGDFSFGTLGTSYLHVLKKSDNYIFEFDYVREFKNINQFHNNRYINRIFEQFYNSILNKKLIETVNKVTPDLIIIIKGSFILPETLKLIKHKFQATIFCFNPDNPFNTQRGASNNLIRRSIPLYDCYFIWGKFLIEKLQGVNLKRVEYLPFAHDPDLHYPVAILAGEENIYGSDVAFIGTWDKEREEFLSSIIDFDLSIWGGSWQKSRIKSLLKKWKGRDVQGEEFSKVCNASKIIINHLRSQNGDAHNMKTFEIPACRGFMLTKRTSEHLGFYIEGKEIACYETVSELRDKIKYYLDNDDERRRVALSGYNKALMYKYDKVVKRILEVYCSLK